MNSQDVATLLKRLDALKVKKESFGSWLESDASSQDEYNRVKHSLEDALPGLLVTYVHLGYRSTHVLMPDI